MNSTTDLGGVAMCEGNPKLFVNTTEGWLRAEVRLSMFISSSSYLPLCLYAARSVLPAGARTDS